MREILFRGECTETGDWVKGFYVRLYDDKGHESHRIYPGYAETDCGDYYPDFWEVDPETVGQFTGLTDKNGKKIFEGDIFIFPEIRKHKYVVEWDANYACFDCFNDVSGFDASSIEVIGNIHDNPELLETK